jgi:hypothetical protein
MAYNHIYNGKSWHIGLRHRYVRQLLTDRVITIDFVRFIEIWQITYNAS